MATSTELLRVAEHMRKRANDIAAAHITPFARDAAAFEIRKMADELEREAARLQAIEAQRPKRSWPEGWPPFAVLRRAYSATGMHHYPSTRVCERSRVRSHRAVASLTRARWQRVLSQVLADPSSP